MLRCNIFIRIALRLSVVDESLVTDEVSQNAVCLLYSMQGV